MVAYKPDILIIPECEHPDKLLFPKDILQPMQILWFGKNQHKGLAVFSFSKYHFTVPDFHNQDFQMIIPIVVTGGKFVFNLLLSGLIIHQMLADNTLNRYGKQFIITTIF